MILKAGTYRFNNVIDFSSIEPLFVSILDNFTYAEYIKFDVDIDGNMTFDGFGFSKIPADNGYQIRMSYDNAISQGSSSNNALPVYSDIEYGDFVQGWLGEALFDIPNSRLQTHTLTQDTEVDDTFGTWYISSTNYNEVNAKPLAEITYNGETIAQLNAGETATLSCEGKKMVSDVVVKVNEVEGGGGVTPTLISKTITENGTYKASENKGVTIEWDGSTEGRPFIDFGQNAILYKVSEKVFSYNELLGGTYAGVSDTVITTDTLSDLTDTVGAPLLIAVLSSTLPIPIMATTAGGTYEGQTYEEGTYLLGGYGVTTVSLINAPNVVDGFSEVIVNNELLNWCGTYVFNENLVLPVVPSPYWVYGVRVWLYPVAGSNIRMYGKLSLSQNGLIVELDPQFDVNANVYPQWKIVYTTENGWVYRNYTDKTTYTETPSSNLTETEFRAMRTMRVGEIGLNGLLYWINVNATKVAE